MESERSASDLTPHWQAFRDDKPEVHEFLEALAEAIHVRGEDCAPLSSLDDTGIEAAELEGLVERSTTDGDQEERVAFTDEGSEAFAGACGRVARQITRITG